MSRCETDNPCNQGSCTLSSEFPYYLGRWQVDISIKSHLECNCTQTGKTGVFCEKEDKCGVGYYGDDCTISKCNQFNPCNNGGECYNDHDQGLSKVSHGRYLTNILHVFLDNCQTLLIWQAWLSQWDPLLSDYPYDLKCRCLTNGLNVQYAGPTCSYECKNGVYVPSTGLCQCSATYHGIECGSKCENKLPPGSHGTCVHGTCRDMCYLYDDKGVDCDFDAICMCDSGFFGQYCEHNDYCNSASTCKNGGVCDPYDWLYNGCDCTGTGYHGLHCQSSDCDDHCRNGKCQVGRPGAPTCDCGIGFEGDLCEVGVCLTPKNPCLNGGACLTGSEWPYQLTCDCTGTGFYGHNCELEDCQLCPGNRNVFNCQSSSRMWLWTQSIARV